MKNTFTILEIQQLQKEEEHLSHLVDEFNESLLAEPSEDAISTILAYSKALSVRPSKGIEFIEFLNN
ncbi:MAG: hypothetical protein HND27_07000 [Bacteroidetes bacterium]|jgi:hypothetical protein|nr:hypothetical protein [Bacteroidota bacterium]MBV6460088.1 hypothetical protein [Flavobacteriales bacterium]WKZ73960.1 MAG: hypothetical protein QY303_07320 [Vicingaceae bacterium]MCL4816438.1 hypothetical protein [Flavobacteriales bacterium]NOG95512.1 hypothetical protein [Bacteroidota bacterium]